MTDTKAIIPALVTGRVIPLQIELNPTRAGPFDAFRGTFSPNLNDFSQRCRLNVTFIPSERGYCYSNDSCTGALGLLTQHGADFSIFGMVIDSDTPINSLSIGSFNGAVQMLFQSIPYTSAYRDDSDILYSAHLLSPDLYIMQVISLLCTYLLINGAIGQRLNPVKLISFTSLFSWFMGQSNHKYQRLHRQVASMVLLFNSLFTLAYISCSFNAEMAVERPAQYYQSLEEIVKYRETHNTVVLISKNSRVYQKYAHRQHVWSELSRIATAYTLSSITDLPAQVARGSVLVTNSHIANFVRASLCSNARYHQEYQLLRESTPLAHEPSFMVFSLNSSTVLKYRVSRLILLEFEAGIVRHDIDRKAKSLMTELFSGDPLQIHRCEGRQRVLKWPSDVSTAITYSHCRRLLVAYLSLMSIASLVFASESVFYLTKVKDTPKGHYL